MSYSRRVSATRRMPKSAILVVLEVSAAESWVEAPRSLWVTFMPLLYQTGKISWGDTGIRTKHWQVHRGALPKASGGIIDCCPPGGIHRASTIPITFFCQLYLN